EREPVVDGHEVTDDGLGLDELGVENGHVRIVKRPDQTHTEEAESDDEGILPVQSQLCHRRARLRSLLSQRFVPLSENPCQEEMCDRLTNFGSIQSRTEEKP